MISILINIGTIVLILVALFLSLVILAQRSTGDGGMSAMGGGMMESTFGPDTTNVLSGLTIKGTIAFFLLSFVIYLGYVYQRSHPSGARGALPNISAPATAPATLPGMTPKSSAPAAKPITAPPPPAPAAPKDTTPGAPAPKTP